MAERIDFSLGRGESRTATFSLFEPGGAVFNATGFTVSMSFDGPAGHLTKTGTLNSPNTLGTGTIPFTAAETLALKPTTRGGRRIADPYRFVLWARDASNEIPMYVGWFDVDDIPARL